MVIMARGTFTGMITRDGGTRSGNLKHAPTLWTSSVNEGVVELVNPREGETMLDVGAGMGPAVLAAARRVGGGQRSSPWIPHP